LMIRASSISQDVARTCVEFFNSVVSLGVSDKYITCSSVIKSTRHLDEKLWQTAVQLMCPSELTVPLSKSVVGKERQSFYLTETPVNTGLAKQYGLEVYTYDPTITELYGNRVRPSTSPCPKTYLAYVELSNAKYKYEVSGAYVGAEGALIKALPEKSIKL